MPTIDDLRPRTGISGARISPTIADSRIGVRGLESVPAFEPVITSGLTGGNFQELFHGEFSEFIEAVPIMDTTAPNCPSNLTCLINTTRKEFFFTWYWPVTNSSDGSIQNDIKEFEVLMYDDNDLSLVIAKTAIPSFKYIVPDNLLQKSFDGGLKFSVRAIDYHDLVSETSKVILVKLNKDFGCRKKEIDAIYISNECGKSKSAKKYELNNKLVINSDTISFNVGAYIGLKEPFKDKTNYLIINILDLNTGKTYTVDLEVSHNKVMRIETVYGIVPKTSDILSSIRRTTPSTRRTPI
jgi:hypothetical protein